MATGANSFMLPVHLQQLYGPCTLPVTPCQHLQQCDTPSFCVLGLLMGGHLPITASTATLSKAAESVAMGYLPTTATQRCCLHHISCRCFHPSSFCISIQFVLSSTSAVSCPPHQQCLVHHVSRVLSTISAVSSSSGPLL